MRETTIKLYHLTELPDDIQTKIISNMYDINVDYEWWNYLYDDFKEALKEIGVYCEKFYFDLDRDSYIAMEKPSIKDTRLFLKYCKVNLRTQYAREILNKYGIQIQTKHHSGNYITHYVTKNGYDEQPELTECLNDTLQEFLSQLQQTYNYLTSEEAIRETIEANEYEFTQEGELF